jgi:peptidoglycan/LPS O-acetylase OafA/YrhL
MKSLRGHLPALDGIRGIAILLVLAHNFNIASGPLSLPARAASLFMDWGWVGVQLFFVLSGFLITGILFDTRESPGYFRTFFTRRVLRIFPLYYAVLIVAFLILPHLLGHSILRSQNQVWLWLYLSNWADPFGRDVDGFGPFWSLAVEEQFYLVWPFVVRRLSPTALLKLCGGIAIVALASRILLRVYTDLNDGPYEFTICRFDALAMGASAALLLRLPNRAEWIERHQKTIGFVTAALFVAGGLITRGYPRKTAITQTFGYSVLGLVFTVFVIFAVLSQLRGGRLARILSFAPLRAVGKYSYAMYVFHTFYHAELGLPFLARHVPEPRSLTIALIYFAVMTVLTYLTALLSYHLLEKHFLALKRRFPSS